MKMRTKFLAAILAAGMLAAGLALAACSGGPSVEEQIKQDLASQLDSIKDLEGQEGINELIAEVEAQADLSEYGVSSGDYVTSVFDGFDYAIGTVTVNEEDAVANVTLTCKSFNDATVVAEELTQEFVDTVDVTTLTDEDLNKKIGEILIQSIEQTQPKQTEVQIRYVLKDGAWTLDEDSITNALNEALFA